MKIFLILLLTSLSFSSDFFNLKESNTSFASIELNIGDINIESNNEYHNLISSSDGKTQVFGEPELPTYSFNYGIDRDKEYSVEIIYNEYDIHENINLFPSQPLSKIGVEKLFVKNENLYKSDILYPESNYNVRRMSMRGYELLNIEVIPFEYNALTKELKIYNNLGSIYNF